MLVGVHGFMSEIAKCLWLDRNLDVADADVVFTSIVGEGAAEHCAKWRVLADGLKRGRRVVFHVDDLDKRRAGGVMSFVCCFQFSRRPT